MVGAVVQAGDVTEPFAAGLFEVAAVLDLDLLEGLDAVGGEAGAGDIDAAVAGSSEFAERFVRLGEDPLLPAELGLKGAEDTIFPLRRAPRTSSRVVSRHWHW